METLDGTSRKLSVDPAVRHLCLPYIIIRFPSERPSVSPPSQRSIRLQQDREKSRDLLRIYGGLLTPKQYAMTSGFVLEGKSFSQIAREHGISRQAVHEVVRSVQRLLSYYESKLLIRDREAGGPSKVRQRLETLRDEVTRRGTQGADWIVTEIDSALQDLEMPQQVETAPPPAPDGSARSPKSASGSARRRR